jgi:thiol-disulfide isomerase/thioredoxin
MTTLKIIKVFLSFALICFLNPLAHSKGASQDEKNKNDSRVVIVEGKILNGNGNLDTVILSTQREFIFNYIGRENYQQTCDSNGYFKFVVNIDHIAKISLFLNGNTKILFSNFYIQPGDTIFTTITKGENRNIIFSGNRSEKFKCMYALDSSRRNPKKISRSLPVIIKDDSVTGELLRSFESTDQYNNHFFSILLSYRNKINPEIFKLLLADIMGDIATSKCYLLLQSIPDNSLKQKKEIARLFFHSVYHPKEKFNDSIVIYSENYIEFLMRRSQIKLKLASDNGNYLMKDMVMLIEKNYQGILRDRLFTYYLLSPKIGVDNQEYEYCLKRSLAAMKSPVYKKYLEAQLTNLSEGSMAYNFSLPDSSGLYVSLSDFKGKVVLIDFWFTGCSSCIKLAKILEKEVIPRFNDSTVKFVSICLDNDKNTWIKSINRGVYTSERSINLFAQGLAFDHPLVRNYNIQGCPVLLLVDGEGRIASASPSWDAEKLCSEITCAIKKNSRPG